MTSKTLLIKSPTLARTAGQPGVLHLVWVVGFPVIHRFAAGAQDLHDSRRGALRVVSSCTSGVEPGFFPWTQGEVEREKGHVQGWARQRRHRSSEVTRRHFCPHLFLRNKVTEANPPAGGELCLSRGREWQNLETYFKALFFKCWADFPVFCTVSDNSNQASFGVLLLVTLVLQVVCVAAVNTRALEIYFWAFFEVRP